MQPEVSVIVPVYNTEKYLKKCVDSILAQTFENIEIILVDDGSTDSSPQICDEYVQIDPRIKVIHKDNFGVSKARETGVLESTGNFICFVDADDYMEAAMVETLLQTIVAEQADSVECGFVKEYPGGKLEFPISYTDKLICTPEEAIQNINFRRVAHASVWNKIWKREKITSDYFRENVPIGEDYYFIIKYFLNAKKVVSIPDILYHYVQHQESVTYTGYRGNGTDIIRSYTEIKNLIIKKCPAVRPSAIAYWTMEEMAVIISMIKANRYDTEIIRRVQTDLKTVRKEYFKIKEVPLYLKVCCALISRCPWIMIYLYKNFFKWRYYKYRLSEST